MNKLKIIPIILEKEVNRQSYLLKTEDEIILFDPGAKQHVPALLTAIKQETEVADITHVILQSNDFLNSTSLDDLIKAGFKGDIIANEAGLPYLETMLNAGIKTIEELDYQLILKNNQILQFIPMPFLPFPECFGTYCVDDKILFSGHLFSQSVHENKNIKDLIQAIHNFHEMVLPSVEFVRHVMKKLKKIDVETIYPRLGFKILKDNISEVFLAILKYDFYNSQQVVERKNAKNVSYNYETICNHMLKQLETKYHREDILEVFKDSSIKLELMPSLEIESTMLTGYKLWNGFFDLIYKERGVKWLTLLEPIVKKYNRTYNIKLPVIYKTKFVEQLKKIENLNAENVKLEEEVQNLTSQVDETMDKLLRCPITNLYNQRFMIQHLLNNLDQPLEEKKTRGLLVIQIDNLIDINKKYGSNKGDETLRNLVHIINRIKSEDTILFKRNGPGIFVYKHSIDEKMLTIFALKLMNNVKESEVFLEPITVSIGIVTIEELNSRYSLEERVNQFIDIALMRLEKAKLKGKGQVVNKNTDKDSYVEGLILLVDEDETNQNLMVKIFERINYQIIIAKDIYHAYEMLEKHNIDIIISEINLSKLDGFRLKQKINASANYKNIPFIIVSHHKNLDVIMRANLLDIYLILQKPIIPEELIGHIKRIRDKRVIL